MISLPEGTNFNADIGYIVLPTDIDRDTYITYCLRTSTVSIQTNDGAYYNRIPLSKQDMNFIDFPKEIGELGSCILVVNHPINNHFIGATILSAPTDVQELQENQFKFKRIWEDGYVEITGSGKDKYIGIVVNSDTNNGNFSVKVNNKNSTAKLQLQVQGTAEVIASKDIKLLSFESQQQKVTSLEKNKSSIFDHTATTQHFETDEFDIQAEKIRHNSGSEPMVKGSTLAKKFVECIELITKISVPTALGPSGFPINTPAFTALKETIDEIKSKLSYLD